MYAVSYTENSGAICSTVLYLKYLHATFQQQKSQWSTYNFLKSISQRGSQFGEVEKGRGRERKRWPVTKKDAMVGRTAAVAIPC